MVTRILSTVLLVVGFTSTASAHGFGKKHSLSQKETEILELAIGTPISKGKGCPKDTVGVSLTEDKKTVSFIFDQFVSESGNSVELRSDRKRCSITLPIDVPKGWQVTVLQMEQRGFFSVPKKASAQIRTQYSLWSKNNQLLQRSLIKNKNIRGPAEDEYTISTKVKNTPLFSHCGQKVNFKMDTVITTTSNKKGDDVLLTVDSVDASADNKGFHLSFLWKKCRQKQ